MSFASDIDAAVARLERRGGLALATSRVVTPERVRAARRRARDLRAEALRSALRAVFRRPPRVRFDAEPTASTLG